VEKTTQHNDRSPFPVRFSAEAKLLKIHLSAYKKSISIAFAVSLSWACLAQPGSIRYDDVAQSAGLAAVNIAGGVDRKELLIESTGNGAAIYDLDGNGWNDVFLTNGDRKGFAGAAPDGLPRLYRNDNGNLRDVTAASGISKLGWGQGVCIADFDNDSKADLFLTYYGQNALYRNLGGMKFREVTREAGLLGSRVEWGAGCAFVDYNKDGYADLFVSRYVDLDMDNAPRPGSSPDCLWKGLAVACGPRGLPVALNSLYRNNRDGTFTDVSAAAGIHKPGGRYGLGVAAADFDNDGWPDIYVACDMTPSLLYQNRGNGTFLERGVEAGVAFNADGRLQSGMGVAVGDYDRNGFLDLAKTNFSGDLPSLFNNEDGRFFTDVALAAGLARHQYVGWGAAFVDADEDGWQDLVLVNGHVYPEVDGSAIGESYRYPSLLYRNLGDGRFEDLTARAGPAFGVRRPARGLAVGDLDNDGRPELLIVNMNERPSLLRNTGPRKNWLSVVLTATRSNRSAIGARVTVETEGGRQIQEVISGGSFYSQHSRELYFGLGSAAAVRQLSVEWPNGGRQVRNGLKANQRIELIEEAGAAPAQKGTAAR
jgi:hypothetical protein